MFLAIIFKDKVVVTHNPLAYLTLIFYALGNIVVPTLINIGFKNFDLNLGSIVLASQLIFVIFLSLFSLGEIPTISEIIGIVTVIVAITLSKVEFKNLQIN